MRHENNIRAQQRCRPHVLNHVAVVANQNPTRPAAKIKNAIAVTGQNIWVDERMQFPMLGDQSIFVHANVGLE